MRCFARTSAPWHRHGRRGGRTAGDIHGHIVRAAETQCSSDQRWPDVPRGKRNLHDKGASHQVVGFGVEPR